MTPAMFAPPRNDISRWRRVRPKRIGDQRPARFVDYDD